MPNELKSDVEEPKIHLPEFGQDSPFHTVSRSTPVSDDPVLKVVQEAVDATRRRLLSTDQHTPWQIMHGLLALRQDLRIRKDGEVISGLDWVCTGPTFDNVRWFEKTRHGGRAQPYSRPYAFEGHANQFLAILSMSGLSLDHEFQTDDGPITMKDMLRNAQMTMNTKDEVTWSLWALSRYLPPDAEWLNENGEPWSIERMVKIQTDAPLKGAPCGGTHGLFALAHARNVYLRHGKPLRGVWLEGEYKIRTYINTARMQQNSNGSLSSNYFRGREYDQDFNKRMASAGHVLEFLMIALPQEELQEQWVRRAIHATASDLLNNRKAHVKCSPLYHSANGLSIYLDRMKLTDKPDQLAAGKEEKKTAKADTPSGSGPSVPATRISNPKAVLEDLDVPPESDDADELSAEQPSADDTSSDEAAERAAEDQAKWRATLESRRTPIVLPEELEADAESGILLPVPDDAGI
ncbi:MAG: hypothetical protein R3C19_02170 [Planctomycetaceae bacterium]